MQIQTQEVSLLPGVDAFGGAVDGLQVSLAWLQELEWSTGESTEKTFLYCVSDRATGCPERLWSFLWRYSKPG